MALGATTSGESSRRSYRLLGLSVLILLLATGARVWGAAARPVWTDEGWSVWAASEHSWESIIEKTRDDHHPPLFFATLSAWWSLAGPSRLALRFLAIAAGVLTTAVVYRVGADWFDARTGRYAALLYAVLPVAVYYAQEIRHYSWLMLATSLMTMFFLRYLRRPRRAWLLLYLLSVAFMLGTLYVGVLVLAVQAVVGLGLWRGSARAKAGLAGAWLGAALLCLPWWAIIPAQITQVRNTAGVPGAYRITPGNILHLADFLAGNQLALLGGLFCLGVWAIVRRRSDRAVWLPRVYAILASGGLFAAMCLANARVGTLTLRTLAFLTPMLMVVCGYGLSRLEPPARALFAAVAVLALLTRAAEIQPRLPYDRVAQALAAQYSPGDVIVLETGFDDNAFQYELTLAVPDDAPTIIRTLPWVELGRPERHRPVVAQVEGLLRTHRRVWVVQWLQPPVLMPFLDAGGEGFRRVLAQATPTGQRYQQLYPDHPQVLAVLYERPVLAEEPVVFGELFALHDAIISPRATPGDALHVDLWWSVTAPPALDYSVGVYLMPTGEDRVLAQHDGPPGDLPTSQWTPQTLTFDRHTLELPSLLTPGLYRVVVGVYWFGNRQLLPAEGRPYVTVGRIEIGSWRADLPGPEAVGRIAPESRHQHGF